MDHNQLMQNDANKTTLNEALSLLRDTPVIRPYQAYCDTEISSRPPSPEDLVPSPLRVRKVYQKQIDMSAQTSISDTSEQVVSLTRVATSSPDKQVDFPLSVPAEYYPRKQNQRMNHRNLLGSTSPATSDHITQPINLCGSYLLAEDEVTAYDFDPAITRVQPSKNFDRLTRPNILRKPVSEDRRALGIIYRPLPQVPLGKVKHENRDRPESTNEHGCVQCPPQKMNPADEIREQRDDETSPGYYQEVFDEATAGSPDQFEDIDLKSPNAQLSPRSPETTFQRRLHQDGMEPLRQDRTHSRLHPVPSLHSSTYVQNGPRPPPWGSYDDLALQRRQRQQRNERRGRARDETRNLVRETTSSVEDPGEGLSREVNEYREQILSVYPDMEFDGHAGEDPTIDGIMSTYFHPRPSTSAPQSPACPGSGRPTIRAITPSSPHDLSNPMSKSCSKLEKPSQTSQGAAEHLFMRPKSMEILQKRAETKHARQGFQHEEVDTNMPGLRRGGEVAGRKSPVKRKHHSKSHRSRPYSTPPATSLRGRMSIRDRKEDKNEESGVIKQDASKQTEHHDQNDMDIFAACPDTPTPMTASQKRFAYLPLGTPTPTVHSQSASKPRSRTTAAPPRTKSAPILIPNRNRANTAPTRHTRSAAQQPGKSRAKALILTSTTNSYNTSAIRTSPGNPTRQNTRSRAHCTLTAQTPLCFLQHLRPHCARAPQRLQHAGPRRVGAEKGGGGEE
ncbi:hypothetical protein BM1_06813 [Bipolaris maydis]|nr:hypothetical protein BM1_06813 [Bipolaris maydis]